MFWKSLKSPHVWQPKTAIGRSGTRWGALGLLLVLLTAAAPAMGEQARVLSEIEQIQEKLWYLQRDLAAQQKSLDVLEKRLSDRIEAWDRQQRAVSEELAGLKAGLAEQRAILTRLDQALADQPMRQEHLDRTLDQVGQSLNELAQKVEQQDSVLLKQAETSGAREGALQALRQELAASQARTDRALAEIRERLVETRSQLEEVRQQDGTRREQLALWGAGAALVLALLLTIAFIVRSSRSSSTSSRPRSADHEL